MKKKGFIVKNILKIAIILIYIFSVTIIVTAAPEFSVDPNAIDPSPTVIEKFEETEETPSEPTAPIEETKVVEETAEPTTSDEDLKDNTTNNTTVTQPDDIVENTKPTEVQTEVTEPETTEQPEAEEFEEPNNETTPPIIEEPESTEPTQQPIENFPVYSPIDEYLYVATDTLNVRKGPSTNHDKIGQVNYRPLNF